MVTRTPNSNSVAQYPSVVVRSQPRGPSRHWHCRTLGNRFGISQQERSAPSITFRCECKKNAVPQPKYVFVFSALRLFIHCSSSMDQEVCEHSLRVGGVPSVDSVVCVCVYGCAWGRTLEPVTTTATQPVATLVFAVLRVRGFGPLNDNCC